MSQHTMHTPQASMPVGAQHRAASASRRGWLRGSATVATAALVLLSGCAAFSPATPEEQVQKRAQARWQSLAAHRFEAAYALLAPSLRELMPQERWVRRFGTAATWKSADVVQVSCEASRCVATVRLTAVAPGPARRAPEITTHLEETGVLEDGAWWFFQKL